MAKWAESLARRFGFERIARAPHRRDFAAAALTRLTSGWTSSNTSANADLYRNLDVLRARSRDLCQNNSYAHRFLSMVAANIVGGTGIRLQARVYDRPEQPDKGANDAIETAFDTWGLRGACDVTGTLSWRDLQKLVITSVARDGEVLVRKIRGRSAGNAYGFALQVIDIDRLDTRLMRKPEKGNTEIRMGVEINAFGRPLAYWLRPYHPGDQWIAQGEVLSQHERVSADDIYHVRMTDRPEQLRGLPWMHAAMVQLQNLGGYEEAAVIAARVGASKMGFFTSPDGESPKDGESAEGVPFMSAEPGEFGTLPAGMTFENFNPDYPHAMYADFTKACLRGISAAWNVSYHGLSGDLTDVNFSSIRSGTLEERDQWIGLQQWFIDAFVRPVYLDWLPSALAFGQVALANGAPLPLAKLAKFSAHTWQARRWQWVDPLKDMNANILAIENGLKSPQSIAAELGTEFEDVLQQIAAANEMAQKLGITLGPRVTAAPAAISAEDSEDTSNPPAKPVKK